MADDKIQVKIEVDAAEFKAGADQASESAQTIKEKLEELKASGESGASGLDEAAKSVGSFGSALASMGQIAAGVFGGLELEGFAEKFKSFFEESTFGTFELAESFRNLSIGTGLTTDQVQELKYAGDITGVSMGRLQQEVNSVARAMTEFADGSKRATDAAATLGLDPSKWTSAYDALTQIGAKYKELTASGQQLGLANEAAFQVFLGGRFGMQSLAALERLPELEEQARAAGVIMGKDMIAADDQAAESIHKLSAEWGALEHQIGSALAPAATLAMQAIGERVFGLQPDEGGGVAGNDKGSGEMQAENLQPAIDAQNKQTVAVQATKAVTDDLMTSTKDWAALAKSTLGEITPKVFEYNQGWQDTFHNTDMAATVLDHVKAKWEELQTVVEANKTELKDYSEVIASAVTPITSAFEQSFSGVIAGTQTLSQSWKRMLDSMGLELLKSGLHDLLLGGSKNTIGAEIFGTTGAGGGIAGAIASAFSGSAVSAGLKASLTNAWTGLTGPITNVFGQAFNAIGGIIRNLFGNALSGAGSSLAGAGASAAIGAGGQTAELAALTAMQAELTLISSELVAANIQLDLLNLPKTTTTTGAIGPLPTELIGLTFERGGIVPGGGSFGIPALIHPGEGVLPKELTRFLMDAASRGGSGARGGDSYSVVVNFTANGVLATDLRQHADTIGDIVAQKVRDARFVGQATNRGAFRR